MDKILDPTGKKEQYLRPECSSEPKREERDCDISFNSQPGQGDKKDETSNDTDGTIHEYGSKFDAAVFMRKEKGGSSSGTRG